MTESASLSQLCSGCGARLSDAGAYAALVADAPPAAAAGPLAPDALLSLDLGRTFGGAEGARARGARARVLRALGGYRQGLGGLVGGLLHAAGGNEPAAYACARALARAAPGLVNLPPPPPPQREAEERAPGGAAPAPLAAARAGARAAWALLAAVDPALAAAAARGAGGGGAPAAAELLFTPRVAGVGCRGTPAAAAAAARLLASVGVVTAVPCLAVADALARRGELLAAAAAGGGGGGGLVAAFAAAPPARGAPALALELARVAAATPALAAAFADFADACGGPGARAGARAGAGGTERPPPAPALAPAARLQRSTSSAGAGAGTGAAGSTALGGERRTATGGARPPPSAWPSAAPPAPSSPPPPPPPPPPLPPPPLRRWELERPPGPLGSFARRQAYQNAVTLARSRGPLGLLQEVLAPSRAGRAGASRAPSPAPSPARQVVPSTTSPVRSTARASPPVPALGSSTALRWRVDVAVLRAAQPTP